MRSLPLLLVIKLQMAYLPGARKIETTLIQVYYLFKEGAFSYLKKTFCIQLCIFRRFVRKADLIILLDFIQGKLGTSLCIMV